MTREGRIPVIPMRSGPSFEGAYAPDAFPTAYDMLPLLAEKTIDPKHGDPKNPDTLFGHQTKPGVIYLNDNENTKSDPRTVLQHEMVHSILGRAGVPLEMLTKPTSIKELFQNPHREGQLALERNRRAGDPLQEVPAYMLAYEPEKTPGIQPDLRRAYLKRLYEILGASKHKNVIPKLKKLELPD